MTRQEFIQHAFIALAAQTVGNYLSYNDLVLIYNDARTMWNIHEAAEQARISGLSSKTPYTLPEDLTKNDSQ